VRLRRQALAPVVLGLLLACGPKAPPPKSPPPRDYWAEAQAAHQAANFVDAYALARNVPASHAAAAAATKLAEQLAPRVEKLQQRLLQKAEDAVLLGFVSRGLTIYQELLARFALAPERRAEVEKQISEATEQLQKLRVEYENKLRSAKLSLKKGDTFDAYRAYARAADIAEDQGFPWTFVEEQQLELARSELPETKKNGASGRSLSTRKKRRATSAQPKEEEAIIGAVDSFATTEREISRLKSERDLVERARNYRKQGNLYEALVALEEAKRKHPESPVVKLLIEELEEERARLIDEYLEVADRYFAKQDLDSAMPYFKRIRKLEPENIRANEAIKMHQNLEAIKKERASGK
jgi:tetratricopeptide (TPR) repeat protein